MISKFLPPGNFTLTWNLRKDKMISKFPPPWNFTLTWIFHKDKMISKFPPSWNFTLTCTFHTGQMISKFPPPWNFTLTQLCNPTAYLNLPPTSFFRPCAKVLFFQYPENFSGPTLKFRTWPFWGINGNGNHWVQTCETNIWWIIHPRK